MLVLVRCRRRAWHRAAPRRSQVLLRSRVRCVAGGGAGAYRFCRRAFAFACALRCVALLGTAPELIAFVDATLECFHRPLCSAVCAPIVNRLCALCAVQRHREAARRIRLRAKGGARRRARASTPRVYPVRLLRSHHSCDLSPLIGLCVLHSAHLCHSTEHVIA